MELRFDFDRSLEASAYLLQLGGGSMEYIRLLKLLYIAERELLAEEALPMTGDIYTAMDYGPVLSTVYDIILDKNWQGAEWHKFIRRTGYSINLAADPGFDHLSASVVTKLREVHARYSEMNVWDLVKVTHTFPEWKKNYPGSGCRSIPLEDILEGMEAEEGTLEAIREEEAIRRHMDRVIASAREKVAARSEAHP
jgi:uncharacterized phage-associated protein